MIIYLVTNEDRHVVGACQDLDGAKSLAKEHADSFDCEIGEPIWNPPSDHEVDGFWRVSCYPNDRDFGVIFDLIIEGINYYPTGTKFGVDALNEIPNFLRPQAE